jgi:methionyl-tRNA formyltransferase
MKKNLKIIFAGTPEFAVPTLNILHKEEFQISLVLTQPDSKSGRGMALKSSRVKQRAKELGIPFFQPEKLNNQDVFNKIKNLHADILVVAAYGLIIPTKILSIFKKGAYNVHASILPSWRGAAPIHRAIEAGDSKIGVTIMSIAPTLDTGDMVRTKSINLNKDSNTGEMTKIISKLGSELMLKVIQDIELNKTLRFIKQDSSVATYANKVVKSEAKVIWKDTKSRNLVRKINAFNPFPGMFCIFKGKVTKIWKASEGKFLDETEPGKLYLNHEKNIFFIGTQDSVIEIKEIQLEGKRKMNANEFIISSDIDGTEYFL